MKRFFAMLLATLMLLSCLSGLAEGSFREEFGFALDFSALRDRTENCLEPHNYSVSSEAPCVAFARICYCALPRERAEAISSALNTTEDEKAFEEPTMSLPGASLIGQVIDFESADLDGNPVASADLFRDNRVTMVNLWGTWCDNCLDEMGELAGLHARLREKGCGIVGVEFEHKPIEEVADAARRILADKGVDYPNVLIPEGDPVFSQVSNYPTSFFVDSAGRILAPPVVGAYIDEYEPIIDSLLAEEAADAVAGAGAVKNDGGAYHVIVRDQGGNPVEGALIQFCDDTSCAFQSTDASGVATFAVGEQKVYEVHVLQAPEGYIGTDDVYDTLETWSDVTIVLKKAVPAEEVFESTNSGVAFCVPDTFKGIMG